MNTTEDTPATSQAAGMERKIILGLAIALVVVTAAMYAWKVAAVATQEDKFAQAEAQHAQARVQLVEQARQLDASRSEAGLRLFSTPLAWVIRREVMAANLDQVDQYFTDLVQMPGFQSAVLANPDGKILVASDRKQLAVPFASLYPAEYLQAGDIRIERSASAGLRAIIPILGLKQHLGVLVLEYTPPAFTLK
ncbi:MAG: hypothetical protein WC474_08780 [Hydrogenophilaceae bacterium]